MDAVFRGDLGNRFVFSADFQNDLRLLVGSEILSLGHGV